MTNIHQREHPLLAPQLTLALVAILVHRVNDRRWVLRRLLQVCVSRQLLHLRRAPGVPTHTNQFNTTLERPTAIEHYRFTIDQLTLLTAMFSLPDPVITPAGDNVRGLESLAMLCRRIGEPNKLHTIANEFGRSQAALNSFSVIRGPSPVFGAVTVHSHAMAGVFPISRRKFEETLVAKERVLRTRLKPQSVKSPKNRGKRFGQWR
ncbi:hypothetical protein H257_13313 [Aphanomyces astaci]|uniref:Uncharacterized protein n=1 Tax=Aphanomyces astaci TaxID=112090 RepID=W4FV90_APHAT|nr:hypothetical protein H257_13313 [Aphanomyces astaci]ETV71430.1 hypothetical protein H257_13313 [Aphanomyces astaci]|eukprot:XP_009839095.1 hypothetical protein H257_13313 [Aphanomyces astaci]